MTKLLTFLSSVRLTITQYATLSLAVALGALVVAFRIQGSRLHSAQISLLTDHLNTLQNQRDQDVATATERFNKALEIYNDSK